MTANATRQGPLNWGQYQFWLAELRGGGCGTAYVIDGVGVPPGARPADVEYALNTLTERHEVLRTTFLADKPVQIVHPPKPAAVEIIRAEGGEAVRTAVQRSAYSDVSWHHIDLEKEFPLRARLILDGDMPAVALILVNHVAVDGAGYEVLKEEFLELLRHRIEGTPPALPPVADQPVDIALRERSEDGQRANAEALLWWDEHFPDAPNDVFPPPEVPMGGPGGLHQIDMESPALAAAMRHLELRGLRAGDALLTGFGALLAAWTGRTRLPVLTVSANRLDESVRRTVGSLAQQVPIGIDLAGDPSFAELVRHTRPAIVIAYSCGGYDFEDMKARERHHELRRGVRWRHLPVFNFFAYDIIGGSDAQPADQAAPALPSASYPAADGTPLQVTQVSTVGHYFMLQIEPGPSAAKVMVSCPAETVPAAKRFAWAFEALMIRAATDPGLPLSQITALCGVEPSLLPGWVMVDNCWVNPGRVAHLLRTHPDVAAAAAFAVPGSGGRASLVAYVTARQPGQPTPAALRRLIADALPEHGAAVIVPHRFVVCGGVPADPLDPHEWRSQDVLAEGAGAEGEDGALPG